MARNEDPAEDGMKFAPIRGLRIRVIDPEHTFEECETDTTRHEHHQHVEDELLPFVPAVVHFRYPFATLGRRIADVRARDE
jgi:hypothetical protein